MPPSLPPTLPYATPPRRRFPPTLIFAIVANTSGVLLALSWLQYPTGSPLSDTGGTDIYALLLAATSLLLLPFAIYQLVKRQFRLALLIATLALTPFPVYAVIAEMIWMLKGFHLH